MSEKKSLSRRSFMRTVSGAAIALGASAVVAGSAQAQITDRDSGAYADPANRSGITDSDAGDRAGNGRGGYSASGYTDSDSGPCADRGGNGRGPIIAGTSDADGGACADTGGYGRAGR